jgi:hypothetical protein
MVRLIPIFVLIFVPIFVVPILVPILVPIFVGCARLTETDKDQDKD